MLAASRMTPDARALLIVVIASLALAVTSTVIAARARSRTRARVARALAVLFTTSFAIFGWGRLIEPQWVEVTTTRVAWPGPPLRVSVMGDFHAGRVREGVIARAVRLSNEADPDVVLLAGDYVTGYDLSPEKAAILESLRPLRARRGVFAVLGNHDSEPYVTPTPRAASIARFLEGLGFTVLRNRWIEIAPGATLIGLDENQSHNTDAAAAFLGAPEGGRLLLTHDWHALRAPGVGRFDLAVTGHTHGGQICLPLTTWCPFAKVNEPYIAGLYPWPAGGALFVTRGIGESAVLMRIGRRPEVALIDLAR